MLRIWLMAMLAAAVLVRCERPRPSSTAPAWSATARPRPRPAGTTELVARLREGRARQALDLSRATRASRARPGTARSSSGAARQSRVRADRWPLSDGRSTSGPFGQNAPKRGTAVTTRPRPTRPARTRWTVTTMRHPARLERAAGSCGHRADRGGRARGRRAERVRRRRAAALGLSTGSRELRARRRSEVPDRGSGSGRVLAIRSWKRRRPPAGSNRPPRG
mgnify:CR=1 FL=1